MILKIKPNILFVEENIIKDWIVLDQDLGLQEHLLKTPDLSLDKTIENCILSEHATDNMLH